MNKAHTLNPTLWLNEIVKNASVLLEISLEQSFLYK